MCWLGKKIVPQKTVEEIVAEKSAGMTDAQKSEYWWELSQSVFALLGKVDVPVIQLQNGWAQWKQVAQARYPTLTNIQVPDSTYFSTTLTGLQEILSRDFTNLIKYVADTMDCDKFANTLYDHLCLYYKINSVFPVWGQTGSGYHGFNCAVIMDYKTNTWIARLIEPQTDAVFTDVGPLGRYTPEKTADFLAVIKRGGTS